VHLIKRNSPFEDRFIPEPNSGCWLWLGGTQSKGYGVFGPKKAKVLASRFSYEKYRGPVPAKLHVLHKCDTPSCVNPNHLFVGTRRDNMQDASRKGRMHPGEADGMAKLTQQQVDQIRQDASNGISNASLAQQFNVHRSQISRIVNRRRWKRN
jgi:hypothetical protein